MSLETRLSKLERQADAAPRCTHVISVTKEGEPVPESRCDCDGEHINIVVHREKVKHHEFRVTT